MGTQRESKEGITLNFGFGTILAVVFITLKLTNVIAWSWLWVLSPLWIPIAISLVLFLLYVFICGIIALLKV